MYQAKSGIKNFSLYWGGGPSTKNFSPSLNKYQAKSGVKNFSLYLGGGESLDKTFFPSLNMYQAKSGVKYFFPLLEGGGGESLDKKFFSQSEHVSSQIRCQNFFPLLGGGSLDKNFFPVSTCIKPNLVSKIFPFTETRYPPSRKSETWDPPEKLRLGTPPKI